MGFSNTGVVRRLSGEDLSEFAMHFRALPCWQVALSYGSVVRFEFGERLRKSNGDGDDLIGSATLWLEGDDWRIEQNGSVLADSISVDRSVAENDLSRAFLGESIQALHASERSVEIKLSGGLRILAWNPPGSEMDEEDDLVTLYAPDGRIAGFSLKFGLFLATETDDFRASRWI